MNDDLDHLIDAHVQTVVAGAPSPPSVGEVHGKGRVLRRRRRAAATSVAAIAIVAGAFGATRLGEDAANPVATADGGATETEEPSTASTFVVPSTTTSTQSEPVDTVFPNPREVIRLPKCGGREVANAIFAIDGDAIGHPDAASAADEFASSENPEWSFREDWPDLTLDTLGRSNPGDSAFIASYLDEDENKYLVVKVTPSRNGWFVTSFRACSERVLE